MIPALTPEERQKLRSAILHRMQLERMSPTATLYPQPSPALITNTTSVETTEKLIENIKEETLKKLNLLQQPDATSAPQSKELIREVLEQEGRRIE
ncbi:CNT_collapsed_G0024800.mRNA.1.CDS.1 [Saccharomyces cerevisiae]|nr:CNT_collapsed_G0024800.mRNA.1.CDS.1 [Saccharomyces cerevisiae]